MMKTSISCCKMTGIKHNMPLIAMILNQFIYAAMFLLNKAAISSGMKPSIFVAYRQAIATLILAPLAYFSERNRSSLTWYLMTKIFILSSCGMALSLNLHYASLNYVSATFATAATNTIPALVFAIAAALRIERVDMTKCQGQAKILATFFCLSGATVFTFYKGPHLYSGSTNGGENLIAKSYTTEEWVKGSLLLLGSNLAWAFWLVMQAPLLKEFPTKLRLTTLQIGFSCIITTVYGAIVERNISSWKLHWNVGLLSIAYSGIFVTATSYTLQVWVIQRKGPVFTAIFSPLALILTAVFSAVLFHEALYWGSVLGGLMLVAGLYSFLWGKSLEAQNEGGLQQLESDGPKGKVRLESIVNEDGKV